MDMASALPGFRPPGAAAKELPRVTDRAREAEWADWMRAALAGDAVAYGRVLEAVTPYVRGLVRNRSTRFGLAAEDAEDVVQEVLLTIHLKRQTWDPDRPIGPWLSAIARNKAIDAARRRGYRLEVPIEPLVDVLPAPEAADATDSHDVERMLARLNDRQRAIVRAVSIEGASVRQAAERLAMTEGAVRVALHRALKSLAELFRSETA